MINAYDAHWVTVFFFKLFRTEHMCFVVKLIPIPVIFARKMQAGCEAFCPLARLFKTVHEL